MKPKFIEHIHLDIPKDLTPKEDALGNTICNITNKILVEQVEKIDNKICERIKDIAILNGIDEIYVLDRNAIISALEKQMPKKPLEIEGDYTALYGICPNCKNTICDNEDYKYCNDCGQALDWSDSE